MSGMQAAMTMSKVSLGFRLWGIDFVVRELSRCPPFLIAPLLRKFGATIGSGVYFRDGLLIDNADRDIDARGDFSNLAIGDDCYIGRGVLFDLPARIEIQSHCSISAGVKFMTHSDCGKRPLAKWYPRQKGDIRVGAGSWLGVNAVLLHGVTLGECCVVAAGSVVTKSFESYSVLAGCPAQVVKKLSNSDLHISSQSL